MEISNRFTNKYQVSKTLRFRLEPTEVLMIYFAKHKSSRETSAAIKRL